MAELILMKLYTFVVLWLNDVDAGG